MLPSTTDDAIFDNLPAKDLVRYARVCRTTKNAVSSYIRRTFKLEGILGPYFSETQILELRRLQFESGALISGSTALQFFDRSFYPDSDLDIYVQFDNKQEIALWLDSIGYKMQPTRRGNPTVATLPQVLDMGFPWNASGNLDDSTYDYPGPFVVLDFLKAGFERKIQLLISEEPPLISIFRFHSTCVMNFITYEKAYSLYPRGTFGDRQSLVMTNVAMHRVENYERAYQKYNTRGWTICRQPTMKMIEASHFAPSPRQVGDSKCWTIPISPKVDFPPSDIEGNTWALQYDDFIMPQISFSVLTSHQLGLDYTVAPKLMKQLKHLLARKYLLPPIKLMTGRCFLALVDQCMAHHRSTQRHDSDLNDLMFGLSI